MEVHILDVERCDKTNKIYQARCVSFDSVENIPLTRIMMLAGMSLSEYTRLNNIKGKIERLEE